MSSNTEISGANALNKSMQGLWTTHRRSKINLNSPAPSGANSPLATPLAETPKADTPQTEPVAGSSKPTEQPSETPNSPAAPSKRKTRLLREDSTPKRARTSTNTVPGSSNPNSIAKDYSPPTTRLSDLGGVDASIEKLLELVAMPLCHPEIYLYTGVQPPRGVLLQGPPGCGKTLLANAIAGEMGVPFLSISAPSIVSGMSGESEKTLRDMFEEAKRVAPCLLFIDEIDAITPKRESAQREMERRIVAQFLTCMDDLGWDKTDNKPVIVIGATNRPDSLDAALRRAGRFDHEIAMSVPDEEARARILEVQCSKLRLSGTFDFRALAKRTAGYVGADLAALTGAAGVIAVKRIFKGLSEGSIVLPPAEGGGDEMMIDVEGEQIPQLDPSQAPDPTSSDPTDPSSLAVRFASLPLSSISRFLTLYPNPLTEAQLAPLTLTLPDFLLALSQIQPSSLREGFTTVPTVGFSDIGALHSTREELHMCIVEPIRRPELFERLGVKAPCGVLMWGPPGCGKTLMAKAVAKESGANFIAVKGPELLNKYVGESERAVRQVFARARASSPCVIFFDELDALVPRRDDNLSESSARVVNTLLTELDGLDTRKSVFVIAATNRPDMIDPAMCRPGRLDKLLYVDLPKAEERADITRTLLRKTPLGPRGSEDETRAGIEHLVRERADGWSGADLAALVREAAVRALKRRLTERRSLASPQGVVPDEEELFVSLEDFQYAFGKIVPSVSPQQRRKYEYLQRKMGNAGIPIPEAKGEEGGQAPAAEPGVVA